jgi:Bacterial pre-peptidase C-terminal domain
MKNINFTTTGSVTSTLVFNNFISPDVYSFFAEAGEQIRLETSNTSVDTTIRVIGPDAAINLFDDDGAGFPLSRLVFTTEDTGNYIVVVSSFSGNPGGGDYTLNFARGAAALQAVDEVSEDTERGKSMPEFENQVEVKQGR